MGGYKLYTSKGCPHCESARQCLRARGIKFREISTDDKRGSDEADGLGITELPTLVKDGRIVQEFKGCV